MRRLYLLLLLAFSVPLAVQAAERAYGGHPRQSMDFTPAASDRAPLVLFIHGGAWAFGDKSAAAHMAAPFHARGYAFAAINYRLVPDVTVAQQAGDVAAALAALTEDARPLGIDPSRIILIGHSAGAHLAALVASDPRYLGAHGIPVETIDGVVLLDGAGYDVPRQIAAAGPILRRMYLRAFGSDEPTQRLVSPISHATAPNAARFLIVHSARRADSAAQAAAFARALVDGGTAVRVEPVDDSHSGIFRRFGEAGHVTTDIATAFIEASLASRGHPAVPGGTNP